MIEIETKFKLTSDVTRRDVMAKLQKHITSPFVEKHQIDTVFLLPEQVNTPIIPGSKIMRVRDVLDPKTDKLIKSLLTLKVEGKTKLISNEYEFTIGDGDLARRMLKALGWDKVVTVDKLRAELKTDDFNICIDEVAKLGLFIELEVMAENDAGAENAQKKMQDFLWKLGLTGEVWTTPYDTSIRNIQTKNRAE